MISLDEMLKNVKINKITGSRKLMVNGVTSDSRKVRKDFIYVAIKGDKFNGADFIKDALVRGSNVIISDKHENINEPCTFIEVDDVRAVLAVLSNNFYDNPSKKMRLIGVTGTNGKTTVTHIIEKMLNYKKEKTGLIGTIEYRFGDYYYRSNKTTPESNFINYLMSKMVDENVGTAIMEVSSHSLKQKRVDGLDFDIAVFTNLTSDHLDYHKSIQDYIDSKTKLFLHLDSINKPNRGAVINNDDPCGQFIAQKIAYKYLTYAIEHSADIIAKDISFDQKGSYFTVDYKSVSYNFFVPLLGRHNVYNVLSAIGAGIFAGLTIEDMRDSLIDFAGVPGRLQKINCNQPFSVYVDYAHTEDALKQVLATLKQAHNGKITVVFGCGGDRDPYKRPIMGEVACKYADFAVLTSDNPRSEDPAAIIKQIEKGFWEKKYCVIPDRMDAIKYGLSLCGNDDVLLVAGKGHEKYQVIGDYSFPFDDVEVLKNFLNERQFCVKA